MLKRKHEIALKACLTDIVRTFNCSQSFAEKQCAINRGRILLEDLRQLDKNRSVKYRIKKQTQIEKLVGFEEPIFQKQKCHKFKCLNPLNYR